MSYPNILFETMEIVDNEAIQRSESGNLRTQSRTLNAHRWEISAQYPSLTRADASEIIAFIRSNKSSAFELTLPEYSTARGTVSGTVAVNNSGGYSAGTSTITIDGITGTLLKGDFIKFNGHDKVYMIIEDRSGAGDLSISPSLRSPVANNELLIYDDVPFTVRFPSNRHTLSISSSDNQRINVSFIEAV